MSWTRHDDRRPFTAKMAGLSDAAYRLDDELLSWCAANGTDGRITAKLMPTISPRSARRRVVAELVAARRLHRAGDPHCGHEDCPRPGPDGFSVHDYLEFNPSAEEVEHGRETKASRQAKWRAKLAALARANGHVDASHDASRDVTEDGGGNASPPRDRAPTRVDPDPDPLVVALGGGLTVSSPATNPPPSNCPEHPEGTAGPCGPCGDARRRAETWATEHAQTQHRADAQARSAQARARAQTTAHAIAACPDCDERGYRAGHVCDHDPASPQRAKRGAALARQTLTTPDPEARP